MLSDRHFLVLIGDTIRELGLNVPNMKSVYEGYLFSRQPSQKSIQVEINVDSMDAWSIASKVRPSSWELAYGNYKVRGKVSIYS